MSQGEIGTSNTSPSFKTTFSDPFWCMLLLVRNAVDLRRVFTRILLQFFEATINFFVFLRDWRSRDAFLFFFFSFYDCSFIIKFQDGSEALWTNWKFFKTPLSCNSHKRLELKENQTKYRNMTRKLPSQIRILIYRAWANAKSRTLSYSSLLLVVLPDDSPNIIFLFLPCSERNCLDIVPLIHCYSPCILPMSHGICSSD